MLGQHCRHWTSIKTSLAERLGFGSRAVSSSSFLHGISDLFGSVLECPFYFRCAAMIQLNQSPEIPGSNPVYQSRTSIQAVITMLIFHPSTNIRSMIWLVLRHGISKANSSNCLLEKWAVTAVCLCTVKRWWMVIISRWCEGNLPIHVVVSSSANPLTAGVAYIRVFIFY